jgi:hypothetical protein
MKIVSSPPRLVLCSTLWSLVGHPQRGKEWSLRKKFAAIKAAGFDGVVEMYRPELQPHLERHGLVRCGRVYARGGAEALKLLRREIAHGSRFVDVMLGRHDTTPAAAVKMFLPLHRLARRSGAVAGLETHRDNCAETPEKLAAIARGFERATGEPLPVTWDHSHFATVKALRPEEFSPRLLADVRLIQQSQLFHCRPFNGHHCQIPVTNGRGRLTPEFRHYLKFAEDLFVVWLQGTKPGGELWVCPELGAPDGYALSIHPPVWPDTVRCGRELRHAWGRAMQRARP